MMDRNNMNLIPYESIYNSVRSDDDFPKAWILKSQERCGRIQEIGTIAQSHERIAGQ
jgi:hypothetical protein